VRLISFPSVVAFTSYILLIEGDLSLLSANTTFLTNPNPSLAVGHNEMFLAVIFDQLSMKTLTPSSHVIFSLNSFIHLFLFLSLI
jgi:hypothetical protein